MLISGTNNVIDVSDWKNNCTYGHGYSATHPTIIIFWQVVSSIFSNEERQRLLKFCTSCSRPPFLGFSELYPKFCVSMAGESEDRLPTSSTCINLLKLPPYSSAGKMREKLLYSISSESGFYLS